MRFTLAGLSLFVALVGFALTSAEGASVERVGKKVGNFSLKSHFGKEYALSDLAARDVVVVVFLGTECPLAKLYGPRLAELSQHWGDRVGFLGIDSNQQDSLQELASFAQRHKLEFPLLKDPGNAVADQFAAERTPEVFVLDKDRVVRYWGRVDDQYGFAEGVGYQRPAPTRSDLVEAVNELLAGKSVSVPVAKNVGCLIGRVRTVSADASVTFSNQISRVFQQHCVECHRPGHIGPFSLTRYADAAGWGEMIREVVEVGRMPPWHAAGEHGKFQNDLRLSEDEKQMIAEWVADGCPEGDPTQLPTAREFVEGWAIGEPDQIVYMGDDPIDVPAEGVIDYYHLLVDPGWTEDKWITAAEARPGAMETVHHILLFVVPPGGPMGGRGGPPGQGLAGRRPGGEQAAPQGDGAASENAERGPAPPGRRGRFGRQGGNGPGGRGGFGGGISGGGLIAGYAPGMNPFLNSTDGTTAMHVKAGSKLMFQMHYTPNGTPQRDRSYAGFRFADPDQVKYVCRSTAAANPMFAIPPGADNYEATADSEFEYDTMIANLTPHMHIRGKSFRYEVTYPDGTQELLLDVPAYDFNWQTTYILNEPKRIPKGTKLLCTAHWDNSENNLSNPDPTKTVSWGDQSWEEMMIGFFVEVFPKGEAPPPSNMRRAFGRLDPEKMFSMLDANKDGKLTKEELPERLGERLGMADTNRDGAVSQEELAGLIKLFSGALQQQRD